ncbi:type VI secretion system baseplate subunit TssF [Cytophagaceae bacterium DM2B3-1]|uniref:Type VI secretion system baseplate subunit TssF n=1 Tax=Xanthocytophaga flava TaxID=3048013 RepID=A0ABT7CIS1_9BACT|nr:type VI secretion system baseplate subunit TssF [Xanthocytophaga flavus]MDJ1493637.1 type VI secretion system baseplate subunit TssF [Xanthocytophaga flavus]
MVLIGKQVSKEAINNRLLKNAAHFWGVKNIHSLDPFVRLLMEALSNELFNAYNDIQNTESRILERIARLLTPDMYVSPRPAHAIAYLRTREAGQILHAHSQLGFQKKVQVKETGLNFTEYPVIFTPVDSIRLWNADVKYYASGSTLYGFDEQRNKAIQGFTDNPLPYQCAWVALSVDPEEHLKNVSFYASFQPDVDDWIYTLLPVAFWKTSDGKELTVKPNLSYVSSEIGAGQTIESVFSDYEVMKMLENEVKTIYGKQFITIEDLDKIWQNPDPYAVPEAIKERFAIVNSGNQEPLVWLHIEFPSYFSSDILNSLSLNINAFPVMNRKPKLYFHSIKEINNVIPLIPEAYENFLSVISVSDDRKREYFNIPQGASDIGKGHFSVRYGGVERFDERNAREFISYLTELLRDEVASFAAYGKDFVASVVNELTKKIKMIEQKVEKDPNKNYEVPTYIFVEPIDNAAQTMEVYYWLTNSLLANSIRAGSRLLRISVPVATIGDPVLLTTTRGGRTKLQSFDRVHAYKYALTTRNRLVTQEDIKNFCFYHLGNQIMRVDIRKGLQPGKLSKQGLVATVDVILFPSEEIEVSIDGWKVICLDLLNQLVAHSMDGIRYRVMVQSDINQVILT